MVLANHAGLTAARSGGWIDSALAELLADAASAASMEDLAATAAAGLVEVFCAAASAVYLTRESDRTLVIVASRNFPQACDTVGLDAALPVARAARSRSTLFVAGQTASTLGRTGGASWESGDRPSVSFAAPILVGPSLVGAFVAGFSTPPSPDRCAALGSFRDAIAARAGDVRRRPTPVLVR